MAVRLVQNKSSSSKFYQFFVSVFLLVVGQVLLAVLWQTSNGGTTDLALAPLSYRNASEPTLPTAQESSLQKHKWWLPYVDDLVLTFPKWRNGNHSHEWCVEFVKGIDSRPRSIRGKEVVGLIYTKSPKTASSTGVGVSLQMAQNVAKRLGYSRPCTANTSHPFAHFRGPAFRVSPSFMWTTVRIPHRRELSGFLHFLVQRQGVEPTPENQVNYFTSERNFRRNNQIIYINAHKAQAPKTQLQTLESAIEYMKEYIFRPYDFIAVTERMDESLVVLKHLLGLEHRDLLVLHSKKSGSYLPWGQNCTILPSYKPTPLVEDFVWTNFTIDNYDYLLYDVINQSLDQTIEKTVGRDIFERDLALHRKLQKLVERECQNKAIFPCSSSGVLQEDASEKDCFSQDSGCGHACVQDAMDRYERGELAIDG